MELPGDDLRPSVSKSFVTGRHKASFTIYPPTVLYGVWNTWDWNLDLDESIFLEIRTRHIIPYSISFACYEQTDA